MPVSPKKSLKKSKSYKNNANSTTKKWLIVLLIAVVVILGVGLLVQSEQYSLTGINFMGEDIYTYGLPLSKFFFFYTTETKYFDKKTFLVYYNATLKVPNLVYEHQNKEHLTSCNSNRTLCEFFADPLLPVGEAVKPTDYYNSNYDRGHMSTAHYHCKTQDELCSSFVLTNIAPQLADLNRIHWQHLEIYLNNLLKNNLRFGDVATGPIFYAGKAISYINNGKIAVPHAFFKLVLGKCSDTNKFIAVTFIAEHKKNNADFDFFKWLTTLEEVEKLTGAKFYPKLPRSQIKQITQIASPTVDLCSIKN